MAWLYQLNLNWKTAESRVVIQLVNTELQLTSVDKLQFHCMEFKVSNLPLKHAKLELNKTTDSLTVYHYHNHLDLGYISKTLPEKAMVPHSSTLAWKIPWTEEPGGKESAHNVGDPGPIPESGRSPGEGNGYLYQYSCLENSIHRGAWQATQFMGSQMAGSTSR